MELFAWRVKAESEREVEEYEEKRSFVFWESESPLATTLDGRGLSWCSEGLSHPTCTPVSSWGATHIQVLETGLCGSKTYYSSSWAYLHVSRKTKFVCSWTKSTAWANTGSKKGQRNEVTISRKYHDSIKLTIHSRNVNPEILLSWYHKHVLWIGILYWLHHRVHKLF